MEAFDNRTREQIQLSQTIGGALREKVGRLDVNPLFSAWAEGWCPDLFPHYAIMRFLITLPFRAKYGLFGQKVCEREAVEETGRGLFELACALAIQLHRDQAPHLFDDAGWAGWGITEARRIETVPRTFDGQGNRKHLRVGLVWRNLCVAFLSKASPGEGAVFQFERCFPQLSRTIESWEYPARERKQAFASIQLAKLLSGDDAIILLAHYYALGIMTGWIRPSMARGLIIERLTGNKTWEQLGGGGVSVNRETHYRSLDEACGKAMSFYRDHAELWPPTFCSPTWRHLAP